MTDVATAGLPARQVLPIDITGVEVDRLISALHEL